MKTDKEIFDSYNNGNIVYMTVDGLKEIPMNKFISQSSDDILKALNRTEELILKIHNTKPDSLKWINDFAVAKTIKALLNKINTANSSVSIQAESNGGDYNKLFNDFTKLQLDYELLKDKYEKLKKPFYLKVDPDDRNIEDVSKKTNINDTTTNKFEGPLKEMNANNFPNFTI